jgi:hypothetical protein
MSRTLLLLTHVTRLLSAVAVLGILCTASNAYLVVSENYESHALGPFGTVSDFSDASYMGANSVASVVTGQALQFSFDVKTGMGVLNTNVAALFPGLAINNSSPNLADYTLEFDAAIPSGINTGWFGVVEVFTPGSGPRTQGLNMGALTPGGGYVHHSMSLAAMGQPFGAVIDPTNDNWGVRLVALGFPANGGGGTVRTTVLLDNVRVTSVIPEPSSMLLGIAFTAAISLLGRRRRNPD